MLLYVVVLYLYLHLFIHAFTDDAFITFCYVKNILGSLTWDSCRGTLVTRQHRRSMFFY